MPLANWLTHDQKRILRELDFAIDNWPQGKPSRIHLRPRHYKEFDLVCRKKKEFPEANADIPVTEAREYRGVLIEKLA